jgi:hypothetical protein
MNISEGDLQKRETLPSIIELSLKEKGYRELTEVYPHIPKNEHLNNPKGLRNIRNIICTLGLKEIYPIEEYLGIFPASLVPESEASRRGMLYAVYGK